jgi:hypothetical protein
LNDKAKGKRQKAKMKSEIIENKHVVSPLERGQMEERSVISSGVCSGRRRSALNKHTSPKGSYQTKFINKPTKQ